MRELTIKQLNDMYVEAMSINNEMIDGKFFATTQEELISQALSFLKELLPQEPYLCQNSETILIDINWNGEGLYAFWAIGLFNKNVFELLPVTQIFQFQTDVNYRIFLGDSKIIKVAKEQFVKDRYVYTVWNHHLHEEEPILIDVLTSHRPLGDLEVLAKLEYFGENDEWDVKSTIEEVSKMNNKTFYEFLKQYEQNAFGFKKQ